MTAWLGLLAPATLPSVAVRQLPTRVNLRFWSGFSTPKGLEDSARGFNPGESVSQRSP
jgi:hypothetical protein